MTSVASPSFQSATERLSCRLALPSDDLDYFQAQSGLVRGDLGGGVPCFVPEQQTQLLMSRNLDLLATQRLLLSPPFHPQSQRSHHMKNEESDPSKSYSSSFTVSVSSSVS